MDLYRDILLDHYHHPHHWGLTVSGAAHYTAHNPLCGDTITMQMMVADGIIGEIQFEGSGCVLSIAAASLLTDFIHKKEVKSLTTLQAHDVMRLLEITVPAVRMNCVLLPLQAFQALMHSHV